MKKSRAATIALGIVCIVLAASLAGAIAQYASIVSAKQATIDDLQSQLAEKKGEIDSLSAQLIGKDAEIENLTSQNSQLNGTITSLNAQITELKNQIESKDSQITTLENLVNDLKSQVAEYKSQASKDQETIATLEGQLDAANIEIDSLKSTNTALKSQIDKLEGTINLENNNHTQTLAFHISEKDWIHIPDVNATYNQLLTLNNGTYNILILPEYHEHQNWTEESAWLAANFGGPRGIPLMLDVFASSEGNAPVTRLSTENISGALALANVKYLRFSEVISWHQNHSLPFPSAYVDSVLQFCRASGLKLFWTEWEINAFNAIQTYIRGYEDLVTVSFSTNSWQSEPGAEFFQLSQLFSHWGASVQSWYWETRTNETEWDMPASLLVQHALSAKMVGAEVVQFEPYWYFFEEGQPNENLRLLFAMLQ